MDQHLTVYHIKSGFAEKCKDSFESLLRNPGDVLPFDLTEEMTFDPDKETPFEAQLFVSKPKEEPELQQPSWVKFLESGFGELTVPKTQSIGAVLFVRIPYKEKEAAKEKKELFAFTFGGGRHFLNPKSYEKDYGLHVALNVIYDYAGGAIEPERLKSVAAKTVAANTIRTRKQTDRQASFDIFEVDTRRDTLNAVTGTSPVKAGFWTKLLSGSESLATTPGVDLKKLGDYCKEIADTYRKKTYEDDFGWIDNRREITDLAIIGELQKTLIQTLINTPAKITLTVPEIIDWEKVDHFSFSFDKRKFPDPGGVDLIKALKKIKGLKNKIEELEKKKNKDFDKEDLEKVEEIINALNQESLIAKDIEDHEEGSWSILDCLSGEIVHEKRPYILSEGQVFEVRDNFLKEINEFVGSLNLKEKGFLPCCGEDEHEGDYNENTANEYKTLLLLDKKTVRIPGRTTPIEICDLLKTDETDKNKGCFIHVKRKLHSSSLSHLFGQGAVSADLLSKSTLYRKVALQRVEDEEKDKTSPAKVPGPTTYVGDFSKRLKSSIKPSNFEVSYAIIADWKNRSLVDALPFFSKVNLRKHVEDLEHMGYEVSVARIEICPKG